MRGYEIPHLSLRFNDCPDCDGHIEKTMKNGEGVLAVSIIHVDTIVKNVSIGIAGM